MLYSLTDPLVTPPLQHIKAEEGKVAASAAEAESRAEGLQASLGRLAAMQGKLQQSLVA